MPSKTRSRADEEVRRAQGPQFQAPFALVAIADLVLPTIPRWIDCELVPGQDYRLTAVVEGAEATEDLGAIVFFDMDDPRAGGDNLRMSAKATIPPHVYLRTGPDLHRTDRGFRVNSPVHHVGVHAWHNRGPVTLRSFVIEPMPSTAVDFFFSFDVEASPYRASGDSPIDSLVWCRFGGADYGIGRICDVLEQHGMIGNFMVDFGSCAKEGEASLARIIDHLAGRGHEVHLHLHPEDLPAPTPRAIQLDKLSAIEPGELDTASRDTSRRMIDYTMAVFEQFAQQRPRLFRAGSYRMNAEGVRAAGDLGLAALSNVRRTSISDPTLRGGDVTPDLEPFQWENGVIELPIDIASPETATGEKYVDSYDKAIRRKRFERTFNVVMHSWSLTRRNDSGVHDAFDPEREERLHAMCEHAAANGRARGYGEYLDSAQATRRTVRLSALRA